MLLYYSVYRVEKRYTIIPISIPAREFKRHNPGSNGVWIFHCQGYWAILFNIDVFNDQIY